MTEPMPSRAAIIRAWLEIQPEPRTVSEICAALGQPGGLRISQQVHVLWREGYLTRSGECRRYAFAFLKDPTIPQGLSHEEMLRRKAERERARSKRRIAEGRQRSWEQWKADCEQRRAAAAASKAARKEARRREREAASEARRNAPKPPRPKPAPQPRKVRERVHVAPAPAPVVYQSVDDFIANGGKVERLEPGACSKPLKRIGKPGVFTINRRKAA